MLGDGLKGHSLVQMVKKVAYIEEESYYVFISRLCNATDGRSKQRDAKRLSPFLTS